MSAESQTFALLSNEWVHGTSQIIDMNSLAHWQKTSLLSAISHEAILCIQSVKHSGGYAAKQRWGTGLPPFYEQFVSCTGNNIRSPIHTQMIESGAPVFFDWKNDRSQVPASWASQFEEAGLRNVVGLSYAENKDKEDELLTTIGLYNVPHSLKSKLDRLQRDMMPYFHRAITAAFASKTNLVSKITPIEKNILALVAEGKSNKEIGKSIGRSDETIKARLASLMRKHEVKNRIELAKMFALN